MHALLLLVTALGLAADPEDLRVLAPAEGSEIPLGQRLYESLKREAQTAFDRRQKQYEQVKTPDDVRRWQAERRAFFLRQIDGCVPASAPRAEKVGTLRGDGFRVEKLIYETRPHHHVTALDFLPERQSGQVYLYLDSAGKQADAGPGGPIETLVREGHRVLAVDLRGIGEIECKHPREWYRALFGPNGREFFLAYLLGKSLVGLNTEDIWGCARFLAGDGRTMHVVANGKLGIAALHAAALEPGRFASLTLRDAPPGWADVLAMPMPKEHLAGAVHGALAVYDLPDLVGTLPKGFVKRTKE